MHINIYRVRTGQNTHEYCVNLHYKYFKKLKNLTFILFPLFPHVSFSSDRARYG